MNDMSDSVFTKIIKKEIPADIIYEDDEIIAIHDIHPQANVHFLIIPKKQIPTINDCKTEDAELLGKMILIAKDLAKQNNIADRGYRLVFNCNQEAGQTVFHIHLHLLGGRVMGWPPG
jgi:histidine triad (HIT) family protein